MELKSFLVQIFTSWQVIAVTVVVVLYIMLASYVAQFKQKRGDKSVKKKTVKKKTPLPKKEKEVQEKADE
ncbi:MAG: hypothetical protein LBE74_06585 [Treponema sp.]|jgi:heme/copper-type cytochrome/quinol oxidase subunit 2|nr:hypothetical protein [Treponema sp.]